MNRLTRILLVALGLAVLAGAAIAANVLLLRYADSRNDPVGKLTPRAVISRPGTPAPTTTREPEHKQRQSGEQRDD